MTPTDSETLAGLPRFKCHKEVQAAKITGTVLLGDGSIELALASGPGETTHVRMDAAWAKKHEHQVGGYLVSYEDGYVSWSPQEAFEAGYALID